MASQSERERRDEDDEYGGGKAHAQSAKSGFERTAVKIPQGVTIWNPKKAGVYRIDILPYTLSAPKKFGAYEKPAGTKWYEQTYYTHARIGPGENAYTCPARTAGKKCPICEDVVRLERDSSKQAKEMVKALKVKQRQLFYIIDHAEEEKGVQLWDMSFHLFGKLLANKIEHADEDEPFATFFRPDKKGFVLKLVLDEKTLPGAAKPFLEVSDIGFKPRTDAIDADLYKDLTPLDELAIVLPYDKLKGIYEATGEEEQEEDDRPAKRKPAPADDDEETQPKKKKPAADDDEDSPPPKKKPAVDDEEAPLKLPEKFKGWVVKGYEVYFKDELVKTFKRAVTVEDVAALKEARDDDEAPPKKKREAPTASQLGLKVHKAKSTADDRTLVGYEGEVYKITEISEDETKLELTNVADPKDVVSDVALGEVEVLESDDKRVKKFYAAKEAPADDEAPKKKKPAADDDDDPPPKKAKPKPADDDDDDAPPKKKKPAADDDDEAPPKKPKKPAVDEEDD